MSEKVNEFNQELGCKVESDNFTLFQIPIKFPNTYTYIIESDKEYAIIHPILDIEFHQDSIID
jgi:hypothetical protein